MTEGSKTPVMLHNNRIFQETLAQDRSNHRECSVPHKSNTLTVFQSSQSRFCTFCPFCLVCGRSKKKKELYDSLLHFTLQTSWSCMYLFVHNQNTSTLLSFWGEKNELWCGQNISFSGCLRLDHNEMFAFLRHLQKGVKLQSQDYFNWLL